MEILPPKDRWIIEVKAWFKHPDNILLLYEVEIPSTARRRITHKEDVIIHMEEVLEASRGFLNTFVDPPYIPTWLHEYHIIL